MTQDQLFAMAHQHHIAGDLARAESLYRAVLQHDPLHADSLHRLGRLAQRQGQSEAAIGLIEQAVKLKPRNGEYRDGLGLALRAAGRDAEAIAAFRHAIRLDKSSFAGHYNLGNTLLAQGHAGEAAQSFRRAIAINPKFAGAHNNLGSALRALGEHARAADAYRAALELDPGSCEFLYNLARMLVDLDRDAEAVPLLNQAVSINPTDGPAVVLLADACQRAGDLDGAAAALRIAIELAPRDFSLVSRLAYLLHMLGHAEEAGEKFRLAMARSSNDPKTLGDYGVWLRETGDLDGSLAQIQAGLAKAPVDPVLHYSLALTLLTMGRLQEGLAEYEWRWKAHSIPPRHAAPAWKGVAAFDQTLLISAEQGQGDVIQFLRYVPLAAERIRVVMEIPASLRRLADGVPGIAALFSPGEPEPPHDFVCPLLSLPRALGLDKAALGMDAQNPYLRPLPDDSAVWAARVAPLPGRKIGLVWAGASDFTLDRRRSVPAALFDTLGEQNNSFISLQKDPVEKPGLHLIDWTAELKDFADTAALIANLDLVISVDTSVAHLAGALGKPVWLLNRFDADWRWLREGEASAWYPTLRQFRQPVPGDWLSVLAAVREALKQLSYR